MEFSKEKMKTKYFLLVDFIGYKFNLVTIFAQIYLKRVLVNSHKTDILKIKNYIRIRSLRLL